MLRPEQLGALRVSILANHQSLHAHSPCIPSLAIFHFQRYRRAGCRVLNFGDLRNRNFSSGKLVCTDSFSHFTLWRLFLTLPWNLSGGSGLLNTYRRIQALSLSKQNVDISFVQAAVLHVLNANAWTRNLGDIGCIIAACRMINRECKEQRRQSEIATTLHSHIIQPLSGDARQLRHDYPHLPFQWGEAYRGVTEAVMLRCYQHLLYPSSAGEDDIIQVLVT